MVMLAVILQGVVDMNRGVLAALMLLVLGFGHQASARGGDEPKSRPAREATDRYERECMKAAADASAARAALREQYVKDLDDARKVALEQSDLDEAQRILRVKEEVAHAESRFHVIEARFICMGDPAKGIEPAWTDVTKEIRKLVKNDRVIISLEPKVGDHLQWPVPAERFSTQYHYLLIVYSIDGDVRQGLVSHPRWRAEFPEPRKTR